jgi:putative transposase
MLGRAAAHGLRRRLLAVTRPAAAPLAAGTLADLARSKPALVAENAFLRHQLAILHRSAMRPRCTPADRALLVLLASRVRAWRSALLLVQPDTLLRWHRQLFRRYWRRKSRAAAPAHRPPLAPETVALIRELAMANALWGTERIRGELLKRDIRVATSTIQRSLREARQPTDAWVAQHLREATPFGQHPRYLIRDNDSKFGPAFARVAAATGITELRTAYRAPRQNATCGRFLGSVRRECLDHLLVLGETQLRRVLREYVRYFNHDRPHQGLAQRVPVVPEAGPARAVTGGSVRAIPILGGLHHV